MGRQARRESSRAWIASGAAITIKTYATATALPTIPDEMLTLMGISSAGYLAGKMARMEPPRPHPWCCQMVTAVSPYSRVRHRLRAPS